MRIVRPAAEDEVIAAFLRAEIESDRFGPALRAMLRRDAVPDRVLGQPDLADGAECAYRRRVLAEHRGWGANVGLFHGFPEHVAWSRAALTRREVLEIRFIRWDWWLTVTDSSRRPLDAAERIRAGLVPGSSAEWHQPIAVRLRSNDPPPELIVVSTPARERLVVLEGHVRLTAYAMFPEYLPPELEVFLGEADDMAGWSEY